MIIINVNKFVFIYVQTHLFIILLVSMMRFFGLFFISNFRILNQDYCIFECNDLCKVIFHNKLELVTTSVINDKTINEIINNTKVIFDIQKDEYEMSVIDEIASKLPGVIASACLACRLYSRLQTGHL